MMIDGFLLRSRRVVLPTGETDAVVRVSGGKIASIDAPGAKGVIDIGDLVIMPGLVDTHVHLNEPGRTEWEGFDTGTHAAALGGVTTLVDMPLNSSPVTTTVPALDAKVAAAKGKIHVDVGFHGGVIPGNAGQLPLLAAAGVVGHKAFLVHSGIDEFPGVGESDLREAMRAIASLGGILLAHAEVDPNATLPPWDKPRSYAQYMASRPADMEVRAVAMLIALCRETGCRTHIVHLATEAALPLLRDARAAGLPITVETCPHYLFFTAEEIPDGATQYKCAPPIRGKRTRDALWKALRDGDIDIVATDHSPCPPDMKSPKEGSFRDSWGGIASLQFGLAAVWTEASERGFSPADIARWMSTNPARLVGLNEQKGALAAGLDADLFVWDPDAEWEVTADLIKHRHRVTPYLGRTLRGRVEHVWLRGRRIVEEGELVVRGGGETILRRGG